VADYFVAAVRLDSLDESAVDALASALGDWLSGDGPSPQAAVELQLDPAVSRAPPR
jgi:hypothetical protein